MKKESRGVIFICLFVLVFCVCVCVWSLFPLETGINPFNCYEIWLHFYIYIWSESLFTLLDMVEYSKRTSESICRLIVIEMLVFISLTSALLRDLTFYQYFKLLGRCHPCKCLISLHRNGLEFLGSSLTLDQKDSRKWVIQVKQETTSQLMA